MLMLEQIWDSIDSDKLELPDSNKKELDRRLKKHEDGETNYSSWEEVKKKLANR